MIDIKQKRPPKGDLLLSGYQDSNPDRVGTGTGSLPATRSGCATGLRYIPKFLRIGRDSNPGHRVTRASVMRRAWRFHQAYCGVSALAKQPDGIALGENTKLGGKLSPNPVDHELVTIETN